MEIKLLGTSSAEGWPGMFCACDVCRRSREVGGKNLRTRSSALIDGVLKIDFPPDTMHHVIAQGLDLSRVRYLLFTHSHDDHCAPAELQYMAWMFVPQPIQTRLDVYGPCDVVEAMNKTLDLDTLPLRVCCLKAWKTIKIDRWLVTPIVAQHDADKMCFNYVIADGEKTLLYATDTGWYEEPTWSFLRRTKLDGMVIECTKGPVTGGYMAHMSIPQVIEMKQRLVRDGVLAADGPVVTTHHSHLGGLLHEELEARLNPHGIDVGYDGMVFQL